MVKPGSAWKKPGVNPGFRSAVVAHARQAAAQPPIDKLEEKLREVVSRLDTDRRGDAHRAISQACKKLRDGKNPLEGLKPPTDCAPCHGRTDQNNFPIFKSMFHTCGCESWGSGFVCVCLPCALYHNYKLTKAHDRPTD